MIHTIFSSLLALLVMNVDRYLATHYPLFHRTSMTKGKLLTLFVFLFFIPITVTVMSINNFVIPYQVSPLLFGILPCYSSSTNCLQSPGKVAETMEYYPKIKKFFSLKNISGCLLVVACLLGIFISVSIHITLRLTSKLLKVLKYVEEANPVLSNLNIRKRMKLHFTI